MDSNGELRFQLMFAIFIIFVVFSTWTVYMNHYAVAAVAVSAGGIGPEMISRFTASI